MRNRQDGMQENAPLGVSVPGNWISVSNRRQWNLVSEIHMQHAYSSFLSFSPRQFCRRRWILKCLHPDFQPSFSL